MKTKVRIVLATPMLSIVPNREQGYQLVYGYEVDSGEIDQVVLEDVFRKFNVEHPSDYRHRSVSVGDIVILSEGDDTERYYRCESFGWAQLMPDDVAMEQLRGIVGDPRTSWPCDIGDHDGCAGQAQLKRGAALSKCPCPHHQTEQPHEDAVACEICGVQTRMTGSKRCDRCWELEHRIHADPNLARKILDAGDVFVLFARHGDGSIAGVVSNKQRADAWKFEDNGRDQHYRHVVQCTVDDEEA